MDPNQEHELTEKFISRLEKQGFKKVKSAFVNGAYGSEGSPMHNRVNIWLLDKREARTSLRTWIAIIIAAIAMISTVILTIIINMDKVISFLQKIGLMNP